MISINEILRGHSWRLALLACLIAIPLSVGIFWAWERFSSAPPGRREGALFQIVSGRGDVTPAGLQIRAGEDTAPIIVATTIPGIRASAYGSVVFDIAGLETAQGSGIYFTRRQDPSVGHPRALSLALVRQGRIEMSEDPRWIGEIETLGFIIQGPIRSDIIVRGVTFLPRSTGISDVITRLGRSWAALADWNPGSANFYIGASVGERLTTPAAFVGIWVAWSWFTYLLLTRIVRARGAPIDGSKSLVVLVVLFLTGWSALDIRWQIDLINRLQSVDSDTQADRDASERWSEKKRLYFNSRSRVFIVSLEPDSYQVLRTRYVLAGINSSVIDRLPSINERRIGDFVMFLGDRRAIRPYTRAGELWFGAASLKAELVFDEPMGTLFRIVS